MFLIEKYEKIPCYTDNYRRFHHYHEMLIEKTDLKGFDELYNYLKRENEGELSKEFVEGICKCSYTKVYSKSNGLNYICYYISKSNENRTEERKDTP